MRIHVRAAWLAAFVVCVTRPPLFAADVQLRAPVKRAVLVGINDYTASRLPPPESGPPPDRDWEDLQGAVPDVGIFRELLISRYGFDPANIVTLTDQQATGAAILDALDEKLLRPSQKNDVAFFYYSGHGSQVANSFSDEPDCLDESIVPADSRVGGEDIRDKDLRRIFNSILGRGARLTVVFDSCHSGSGARGFDAGLRPRSVRPDLRDIKDSSSPGPSPEDLGLLIFAAAQDFDLAYETRDPAGNPHGAFSWALENALRDSGPGEPAIDTFLRAHARLRLDMPAQEPMIGGNTEARLNPFLGARGEQPRAKTPIAVERVNPDGTYVLQGGWVNGINTGSELEANGVRIEVTALRGISRCDARVVVQRAATGTFAPLQPGTLLETVAWAAPPGRPLHVWIPTGPQDTLSFARELEREAERRKIRWVADPTESVATHVVRWRSGRWEVLARGQRAEEPAVADPAGILGMIPAGSSVFVQLPAPASLVDATGIRQKGDQDGIEITSDPQSADYILAGRYSDGEIKYAWLRRALTAEPGQAVLPERSRWSAAGAADTPLVLSDAIMRLRRIFGWQHLESPGGDAVLPYDLAIRNAAGGSLVSDGVLVGESRYGLVLRARAGRAGGEIQPRYVYVFVIDSQGKSVLLFPLRGSVENRVPMEDEETQVAHLPSEIPLGEWASFTATSPYGVDAYFLLATDEALPDPWSLEWDGVRGGSGRSGTSPLQQLLELGGTTRSPLRTPPNWSIEQLLFTSVPPQASQTGGKVLP